MNGPVACFVLFNVWFEMSFNLSSVMLPRHNCIIHIMFAVFHVITKRAWSEAYITPCEGRPWTTEGEGRLHY